MKRFSKKLFLPILFVFCTFSSTHASTICEGGLGANDGFLALGGSVSWSTHGDDCCTPTAGSALVEVAFFVFNGDEWQLLARYSYYVSISEAQYYANCPYEMLVSNYYPLNTFLS